MNDWLPAGNVTELMSAFKLVEPMASPPPVPGSIPPPVHVRTMTAGPSGYGSVSNSPMRSVSIQPQGYPRALHLPRSDKSRTVSGILQLIIPGAGRMYLGYAALGVIQFILTFCTFGFGYIWSLVDGIMILSGKVGIDGYGRSLED